MKQNKPKRLSVSFLDSITEPGRYSDGPGAYGLSSLAREGASGNILITFSQRCRWHGKPFNLGLGSYPLTTLREARDKAFKNARKIRKEIDVRPKTKRKKAKRTLRTFREVTLEFVDFKSPGWRASGQTEKEWLREMDLYVFPIIGSIPANKVKISDALDVIEPICDRIRYTAENQVRRIVQVLRWSKGKGYRKRNTFDGKTIFEVMSQSRRKKSHFKSVPYTEVSEAISLIRGSSSKPATKGLTEFIALNACRSREARVSTPAQFDLDNGVWVIPPDNTKTGDPHVIPISNRSVKILRAMLSDHPDSKMCFPGQGADGEVSAGALSNLFKRLAINGTPHGLRSTFVEWCRYHNVPKSLRETALAHKSDETTEAYARDPLFILRKPVMEAYAQYIEGTLPKNWNWSPTEVEEELIRMYLKDRWE